MASWLHLRQNKHTEGLLDILKVYSYDFQNVAIGEGYGRRPTIQKNQVRILGLICLYSTKTFLYGGKSVRRLSLRVVEEDLTVRLRA